MTFFSGKSVSIAGTCTVLNFIWCKSCEEAPELYEQIIQSSGFDV